MENDKKHVVEIYFEDDPSDVKLKRFVDFMAGLFAKYYDEVWPEIENLDVNERLNKKTPFELKIMGKPKQEK